MLTFLAFFSTVGIPELLIILLVILLLFGSSKIPQLMRSMGSGISQFKKGIKEGEKDAEEERKAEEAKKDEGKKDEAKAPEADKK